MNSCKRLQSPSSTLHARFMRTRVARIIPKPTRPPETAPATPEKLNPNYKLRGKGSRFVDYCRFQAEAGLGGDGCISFLKEKFIAKGPPNGGNGGRGGSIWVVASKEESSLRHIARRYKGNRGDHGKGSLMHGQNAQDITIHVPLGTTLTWTLDPIEPLDQEEVFKFSQGYEPLADRQQILKDKLKAMFPEHYRRLRNSEQMGGTVDLMTEGHRVELLKGGSGGMGNPFFCSKSWPSPKVCSRGMPGQSGTFELELKTIADLGLVGMPNAGKSSLLAAISNAHPKIAPYPFTTLNPYVGTIDFDNHDHITVADIPGLIPGAHANVGLGHDFLRHVERCKVLVYVVDLSRLEPWADLEMLQHELEAYKPDLTRRKSLVVCNKADVIPIAKQNWHEMQQRRPDIKMVPCSARDAKNIKMVTSSMRELALSP